MKLNTALKVQGNEIILLAPKLEIYIPYEFISDKLAENYGDYVSVLGLLYCRLFEGEDKPGELELLNLPTLISLTPNNTDIRQLQIDKNDQKNKYLVLTFYKGSAVMPSEFVKNSDAVQLFLNLVIRGKLPKIIPYNKLLPIWLKNMEMNSIGLNVPASILELILMEVYRDPKTNQPYAKTLAKNPDADQLGYVTANMRTVASQSSTTAALTFEDFTAMATSSVNRANSGADENISPLEDLIKM